MFTLQALETAVLTVGACVTISLLAMIAIRGHLDSRQREVEATISRLEPLVQEWLVGTRNEESVLSAIGDVLRSVRPQTAFRSLARVATQQVTFEKQRRLAAALRGDPWVESMLRHVRSRLWWLRFDSARLLSLVGREADAALIGTLLDDRSPAVRLVAMDAAARLDARPLLQQELDTLAQRQDAVQAYQFVTFARHPDIVSAALARRLTPEAPEDSLVAWIDAAGALASPAALECVRLLAEHPSARVRLHVARALRRHAQPETPATLLRLLRDTDWRVRAQAARALGALRCAGGITDLIRGVRDLSWWVRYRSALALAQIGGSGRVALMELMRCDDPMARDMSTLVSGLSSAAVIEMSEV